MIWLNLTRSDFKLTTHLFHSTAAYHWAYSSKSYRTVTLTNRIKFKHHSALLNSYQSVCSLHSQDNHLLAKTSVYISIGRHTLSYTSQQIWNAIPLNIRNSPWIGSFKHNVKTFYFAAVFLIFAMCHQWLPKPPILQLQTLCALQFFCMCVCMYVCGIFVIFSVTEKL